MTHLQRLLLTLAIIFASVAAGYALKRLSQSGRVPLEGRRLDILRGKLQAVSIFALLPLSAMLSLWGLPNPSPDLLFLPFLGLAAYIWGGALALWAARLLRLSRAACGSFYCCGTFTNLGAIGALVCLLFLGENSIALVALYRLFEELFYFGAAFPVARRHGDGRASGERRMNIQTVLAAIVCALGAGLALNLGGVQRPALFGLVAWLAMLTATVFFLFAIGLSLRLSSLPRYWPEGLTMCLIKFAGVPVPITLLAWCAGLGAVEGGLPLRAVCILSSMPVAMTALAPPAIFGLDTDLANACWLYTTVGLVAALPVLALALPLV